MKYFHSSCVAIFAALSILIGFASCSSDENTTVPSVASKAKTLKVTMGDNVQTRSTLTDPGTGGLKASWEMGDSMLVYNRSNLNDSYEYVTATSSTTPAVFTGKVTCEQDDQLRLFYPSVKAAGSVTSTGDGAPALTLNIANQEGTLQDVQNHYDFNLATATVTSVTGNEAVANAGASENLMAICKFTFKYNGEYLKNITNVTIDGAASSASINIGKKAPELAVSSDNKTINVTTPDGYSEGYVYVAMFPGETTPTFKVETDNSTYEGSLTAANLKAGKFYNVTVQMTSEEEPYIEICGVKWAKGNLYYDRTASVKGFVEGFKFADDQAGASGTFRGSGFVLFNNTSTDKTKSSYIDVSGKMYYKNIIFDGSGSFYSLGAQTNDFSAAGAGDLAYWATRGKYRLPNEAEVKKLIEEASYQCGYVTYNGKTVYGVLFTNPKDGVRTTNTNTVNLSSVYNTGLFLRDRSYGFGYGTFSASFSDAPSYSQNYSVRDAEFIRPVLNK